MLLRKHLCGGKITKAEQIGFERIVAISIESNDEMGFLSEKKLIIEIMGKHSNIILADANGKILDCIIHVDMTVSSVRTVLPGLKYELPPSHDKENPLSADADAVEAHLSAADTPLFRQLMDAYSGISPMMAREIIYRSAGDADALGSAVPQAVRRRAAQCFEFMFDKIRSEKFSPTVLSDAQSGKMIEVCATDITQYGDAAAKEHFDSMSAALDSFYMKKASGESMRQKSADLLKFVNNNIDRCRKKLQIQNETLQKASGRDKYKLYGDLVTANIYRITPGAKGVEAQNYYSESGETVKIPLKPELTPAQNAQRYYKKYTKEKTAEEQTIKQKKLNEAEIDYLQSVQQSIENAENLSEVNQVRDELIEQGYLKNKGRVKKGKKSALPEPMHFVSSDGYDIYVGKNNRQNDFVTLKIGRSTDIWFHTKGIHGSHAIVKTADAEQVPDETYIEAASLAAYYSKGRSGENIPVDYTEVKNVKKPSGARPGMVIYLNYNTIYVTPDEKLTVKLAKNKK